MATLSKDERIALIDAHAQAELTKDWAQVLRTMSDTPSYTYFPYRLRVSGPDAIIEMWERTLPLPCLNYSTGRKVTSKIRLIGEETVASLVENTFTNREGDLVESTFICVFDFADGKIAVESIHLDANMTPYFDDVFTDPDFLGLPGVESF